MRAEILGRFEGNVVRARNLVQVYGQIARQGQGRQPVATVDVLRAATVFLHASLEEVARNIARWKYPGSGEPTLNEIPIVGSTGRAERFLLGRLASHRGKTIQAVIDESVDEYLSTFTINSTTELSSFLSKVGVNPNTVNGEFATLAELFARRHHIVHQVDRNDEPGQGHHEARGLNQGTVTGWIDSVDRFVRDLLPRIPD